MNTKPIPIQSQPGFGRDSTRFENARYTDGQWCRFYQGRPKKINGYRALINEIPGVARTVYADSRNGTTTVLLGSTAGVYQFGFNSSFTVDTIVDRSPAGMTSDPNRLWQIDQMFDAAGSNSLYIGHPNLNLTNIDSTGTSTIYYGSNANNNAFTALNPTDGPSAVCGGVCVIHPYLFVYCSNGFVTWSGPNTPFTFTISSGGGGMAGARIASTKIIKGMPFRSGQGPAGVFWGLNSVIRAQWVGGAAVWNFNTVSNHTSVMSTAGIVEYDGIIVWPGIDKFYMYNGTVQELPNEFNSNWFFSNINMSRRQTVFGFSVPRWGETWWCFPFGNSQEPNKAIIYNHKYRIWYDTDLPRGFRYGAINSKIINTPLMTSADYTDNSKTTVWAHEIGLNEQHFNQTLSIRSFFETGEFNIQEAGEDRNMRVDWIDLDFRQSNSMSVQLIGRVASRDADVYQDPILFGPNDPSVEFKQELKHARVRFESNTLDGDYHMGKPLIYVGPGSRRRNA